MYLIQSLCKYYVSYQGHMMGANMERDMRQQLFDHYEELSFSYYSQNNSGQMMSKLVSDLFDISEFAHHGPDAIWDELVEMAQARRSASAWRCGAYPAFTAPLSQRLPQESMIFPSR